MAAERRWLWIGSAINALLFIPGAFMAATVLSIAQQSQFAGASMTILLLFGALPVFCVASPGAAWRAYTRNRPAFHIVALLAAPSVYAVFLMLFLAFA